MERNELDELLELFELGIRRYGLWFKIHPRLI